LTAATEQPWWRHAAVYQVYPRSFADGNGDGTGDIAGLRSRLGYLRDLGVDAVWLNPWYRSPLLDGGYDVADYRQINEQFGDIDEAEAFIADAAEHGIRVVVDLVPNHTSWAHRWFVEALAAPPGDPTRDRYHFLPGRGDDGELPPNNWTSVFGGSAWKRVDDGEWYLHLFAESQPDVNWSHPDVVAEFESVMRFWLDRGAAGFRVDVAHALVKAPGYPDVSSTRHADHRAWYPGHPFWDRDEIHPIVRRWRAVLDEYDGDRMMVAEAWVKPERLPNYLRPGEYHQAFDFDLLSEPWTADGFRDIIREAVTAAAAVGSSSTWVLSNHDVVRHRTRYGLPDDIDPSRWLLDGPHDVLDDERGRRRGRAAALLTLALPGSVYVYQGDELGLPEVWDLPTDVLDDPVWEHSGHTRKGRDGCRVPIPWTTDGPSFGFGTGPGWLPQPPVFGELSAAAQAEDPDSTLSLYRQALALRRELLVDDDELTIIDAPAGVVDLGRGRIRVTINMSDVPVPMPPGEVVLASSQLADPGELPPDVAVWLRRTG
jgi:alpha-glucosidase